VKNIEQIKDFFPRGFSQRAGALRKTKFLSLAHLIKMFLLVKYSFPVKNFFCVRGFSQRAGALERKCFC